ncbi:Desmethylxanthohumol 6'-O-methyltransferase, partial [Turnera subulata]
MGWTSPIRFDRKNFIWDMGSSDSDVLLRGQPQVWQMMFGFADSMALKCAVELRIADIINSHGGHLVSLSQIAS